MKQNEKIEELQSRRDFFKNATQKVLPILGAIAIASNPLIGRAMNDEPSGCEWACTGGCQTNCYGVCKGDCTNNCAASCGGNCTGRCYNTCTGSCNNTCHGTCSGGCARSEYA